MNVYIVIPHYNNWTLTHARLWELYKYCGESIHEVVVVDDCSMDDMTEGGLRWWKTTFESKYNFKVSSIRTEENLGFLKASNFGIFHVCMRAREDDIVILLSNDVGIRTNFVKQVIELVTQNPKSLVGGVLYSHDTGWNKFGDKLFPYIEGWLLAMTSEGWTRAEWGFDERFAPSDYEDVDLSTFMLTLSYDLVPLNNPGIHHIGGQSYGYTEERRKRTEENKIKFQEKWIGKDEN